MIEYYWPLSDKTPVVEESFYPIHDSSITNEEQLLFVCGGSRRLKMIRDIMNNCKQIHVDMEQEIKEAEEKLEQKRQEEEEKKKQLEELERQKPEENQSITKKDVFAKLKKYNTNTSLKSSGIPTDKKSVSKKNIQESDKPLILKEKANRYSCEGKLMNFSFLKKVDKKVVDKRYAMNFSDFKKMIGMSQKK
jgi:hypothetical protein